MESAKRRRVDDETTLKSILPGLSRFSKKIFEYVCLNEEQNLVMSPIGIAILLAMTADGAQGTSAVELQSLLGLSDDASRNRGYHVLIDHVNEFNNSNCTIRMASKIVTSDTLKIKEPFSANMKNFFQSPIIALNWEKKDKICQIVNDWCREETSGRISDILTSGDIPELPSLLLLNAVYLKCPWAMKFPNLCTREGNFHISDQQKVKVPMMHQVTHYDYGVVSELDVRYIDMPFQDTRMSMMVFMPNKLSGVVELETYLSSVDFCKLLKRSVREKVSLRLPKFKTECSFSPLEALKKMRLKDACTLGTADFSKVSTTLPLFIDDVVQKTFLDVNEGGVEAAAFTRLILRGGGGPSTPPPPPIEFNVNRPFVCAIVTRDYGIPIFIARITDPTV